MQNCIVAHSLFSPFLPVLHALLQAMHMRMRANRKGVDNLCNCIQSLCPSLSCTLNRSMNRYSLDVMTMILLELEMHSHHIKSN